MGDLVRTQAWITVGTWIALAVPALAADAGSAPAAAKTKPVSYYSEIRPILKRKCQGCHQAAKLDGKLIVTTYDGLKAGGRHGAGFEPGKPDESWVVRYINGDRKPRMPKGQPPLPDGEIDLFQRWIAEGAADDTPASAKVAPAAPAVYRLPPVVSALAYSPDGSTLAVAGCHEVLILPGGGPTEPDGTGGSTPLLRLGGLSQRIESLTFSSDGTLLAVVGGSPADIGEVQLWDMYLPPSSPPGGTVIAGKLRRSVPVSYDSLFGASFSADASVLALGCADNSARLISVSDGSQVLRIDHHSDWVFGAMFSVDGKQLITVSRDRAMKLTEVSTGSFIDNITSITPGVLGGGLQCLARHPKEDKFATGGEDGIPRMYKIVRTKARQIGDDDNLLRAFEKMPGVITAVSFSPDGARLLVVSTAGEGRIYEVADGKRSAMLSAGGAPLFAVAYRPDGQAVAVGGKDGLVRVFEVPGGKLLRQFVPVPLKESQARPAGQGRRTRAF